MLSEIFGKREDQKPHFFVVTKVTTYTEDGHPLGITEETIRANTQKELESQMDESRAKLKQGTTIAFGPVMRLDKKTDKYIKIEPEIVKQEVRGKRGIFSKLLEDILPILPSAFKKDE